MTTRALLVDLNNFGGYPTLAIGLLASTLRRNAIEVSVLSPLSLGLQGVIRESQPRAWDWLGDRLRYRSAHHSSAIVRSARRRAAERRAPLRDASLASLLAALEARLDAGCEVVLLSTYLMYFDACKRIVERCSRRGVPVLIGGSYLNQPEITTEWLKIPGLTAVVGGEPEPYISGLVETAASGDPIDGFPGVGTPSTGAAMAAPPLVDLDSVPFADYSDFPWDSYRHRITPMITGRGCGWGVCTFCSDVTSSMGRSYRSRSVGNVLDEITYQSEKNQSSSFVFNDLKLNSELSMWHGLIDRLGSLENAISWIAAVHVNSRGESGLSHDVLKAARQAGLARVTNGLESGSQRVLDSLSKGIDLESFSTFLHDAADVGISVRTTLVLGCPGETAADVLQTAEFLERHERKIERVAPNRFLLMTGTIAQRRAEQNEALEQLEPDHRNGVVHHVNPLASDRAYRRQIYRVLDIARRINRRPILDQARPFEGVL